MNRTLGGTTSQAPAHARGKEWDKERPEKEMWRDDQGAVGEGGEAGGCAPVVW